MCACVGVTDATRGGGGTAGEIVTLHTVQASLQINHPIHQQDASAHGFAAAFTVCFRTSFRKKMFGYRPIVLGTLHFLKILSMQNSLRQDAAYDCQMLWSSD